MELAAIVAGLLFAVGGLVALAGTGAHAWMTVRSVRLLTLVLGLAAVVLAAAGLGMLVDRVTGSDGIAVLDHPIAGFVAAHRAPVLTAVMRMVSAAAGPAGMTVCALIAGVLLSVAWRSWTPVVVLATTAAGAIGLTLVIKNVLARPRPPLLHAVAAADGYGFPSAHAAAAASVCGAAAWLCSFRIRSWVARTAIWAAAAMLAALVGISRVYLGVHWSTDVIGGWIFGVLWLAVIMVSWAGPGHACGGTGWGLPWGLRVRGPGRKTLGTPGRDRYTSCRCVRAHMGGPGCTAS